MGLKHPGSKTRFGNFVTGTIIICESAGDLVKVCEGDALQAERAQAESNLFPQAMNGIAYPGAIRLVSVWFLCMLGSLSSWFALIRLGIWILSKFK
jgi:hypothetical protein